MRSTLSIIGSFFCVTALAAPVPKPTDGEKLELYWGKAVDRVGDCTVRVIKNQLVMTTPGLVRNALVKDGEFLPLRIERTVEGDFEVEVKMIATTEPSHTAPKSSSDARIMSGLFVHSPGMTITLGRSLRADQDKGRDYFDHSLWHQYGGNGSRITGTKPAAEVFVRYTRQGKKQTLSHSLDGTNWDSSESPKASCQ